MIIKEIIEKELESHGVDCEYVLKNQEINNKPWYNHFTFRTEEEYENWKSFSINLLMKKLKYNKTFAIKQFAMIDLNYGLKRDYEDCKKESL